VLLFLEYLRLNDLLLLRDGQPRLTENAVVAWLFSSRRVSPGKKDLMIGLIVNLLESQDGVERHSSVSLA
jgi:hypothetical protein